MTMSEVDEAAKIIAQAADADANIIFGATIDDQMMDQIRITVIATGFDETRRVLRDLTQTRPQVNQIPTQQAQPAVPSGQEPPPPIPEETPPEDFPPIEDEFDIPAFLRQRN
jgi:cell division protein FtsZ